MLFVFKKIRESLLTNNKFSKYLLYAFGEIILVVIGILIAVQLNNWNENKKNNKLQKTYVTGIISDLDYDINAYSNVISEIEKQRESVNSILNCYKEKTSLPDSVLIYHLTKFSFIVEFSHKNTFMDDMKSSGRLNLIKSNSVRREITEYYKLASGIVEDCTKNNNWILNHIVGSNVITKSFDINSTIHRSKNTPEMMKSIEVNEFRGIPFIKDDNQPERNHIINLLTAKNMLEGMNGSYCLNGRKNAIDLKEKLDEYLESI